MKTFRPHVIRAAFVLLALAAPALFAQTAASLIAGPDAPFLDTSSGAALPCVGCTLSTFAAGTSTPLKTYVDSTLTTQNAVIITLDSAGYSPSGIWVGGAAYKFVLKSAGGATLRTQDHVQDGAEALRAALALTSGTPANNGAALIGFEQPSTGAVARTAQAKMQEVFSVRDFGALGDGTTEDSAAFRLATAAVTANGAGTLFIPRGPGGAYRIRNVVTGSNIKIICEQGATLKLPDSFNGATDYMFANDITGAGSTNIDIGQGCILDGNRVNVSGGAFDGNSMAYLFNGTTNTTFHGACLNFWTDCLYLGAAGASGEIPGSNITIAADFSATASRRNNVSIVAGTGVRFEHPTLTLSGTTVGGQVGTAPAANIDIEPNRAENIVGSITGSVSATLGGGYNIQYAEQFAARVNSGVDIDCEPCSGAVLGSVLVTDFGSGHAISGVTVRGHIYDDANGAGVNLGATTTANIAADIDETTAGVIAVSTFGPATTIGAGRYCGATYDFYIDAAATTPEISTAAINCHGGSGFNPAGVKLFAGNSGTFTPTLSFGGGSTGITYGTRVGTYYQVGHTITATIHIVLTSKGSSTGASLIAGLPFPASAYSAGVVGYWVGTAAVTYPPTVYIAGGGSAITLLQSNGSTGSQGLLDTNFTNTTELVLTLTYGQ